MEERTELILNIMGLCISLFLVIVIFLNGNKLDCSKCQVDFSTSKQEHGFVNQKFKMNITDLYNTFKEGYCLVRYNEQGYIYDYTKAE